MKYLTIISMALTFIFIDTVNAQIINGSTDAVVQYPIPSNVEDTATIEQDEVGNTSSTSSNAEQENNLDDEAESRLLTREEIEALIKAEQPAIAITPEQKVEIESDAKKNMRNSIKKQSVRERKDFIDVMTSAEKVKARRQALAEGKSSSDVYLAEDAIKNPNINPAIDSEMENYLFEKAGLIPQDRETDVK